MAGGDSRAGRRMSFGIGGAGNIRNVTEATIHDFYVAQDGGHKRRRSSAAESSSGSSPSRMSKVIDGMKSMFGSSPPKDVGGGS
ncbi:hypothetical protein NKR19_g2127 [Coniochaeta hoffmannii]|uniref:Uncharacterized protein n=1 Tax=Coniochaeta hoffmannii TaxID=91930 RepID=A0AA38VNC2_9PEZI|nr:hypothetical protein NKR19_g2127 [Coniochaeta hoffmannii]